MAGGDGRGGIFPIAMRRQGIPRAISRLNRDILARYCVRIVGPVVPCRAYALKAMCIGQEGRAVYRSRPESGNSFVMLELSLAEVYGAPSVARVRIASLTNGDTGP